MSNELKEHFFLIDTTTGKRERDSSILITKDRAALYNRNFVFNRVNKKWVTEHREKAIKKAIESNKKL